MPTITSAGLRAEPNLTPMIDVMLVLLIVFMVVIPTLLTGFTAEPPRATHVAAHPAEAADQMLGIDAFGHYYLDRQPVAGDALAGRLREIYVGERVDRVLYPTADSALAYGKVLEAIDIASRSGVRVVGMVGESGPVVLPHSRP